MFRLEEAGKGLVSRPFALANRSVLLSFPPRDLGYRGLGKEKKQRLALRNVEWMHTERHDQLDET